MKRLGCKHTFQPFCYLLTQKFCILEYYWYICTQIIKLTDNYLSTSMMLHHISIVLLAFFALPLHAQKVNLDSIYRNVDEAIAASPTYVASKEKNISQITAELRSVRQTADSLRICRHLFDEYAAFRNDSALHYITLCIDLAQRLGDKNTIDECRALAAFQCSSTGLYVEARDLLGMISFADAAPYVRNRYLLAASHLYGELGFYGALQSFKTTYYAEQGRLNNIIFATFDHSDDGYLQRKEMECYSKKDFRGALRYNDQRMKGLADDTRQYAVIAFYRYLDYTLTTDTTMQRYWLCKAAICDVKNAVMDQGALWELANQLQNDGDLERSQRYIQFAWQSATTFGTRVRNQQIIPVLSHIDNVVQDEQKTIYNRMVTVLICLAVLLAVLLILVFNMWKQHQRLRNTRDELRLTNDQLTTLNNDMHSANELLNKTLLKQEELNTQLAQANKLKEEYVGQFMRLCSQYIDRSDDFRKRVYKLLKKHDYDRLMDETKNKTIQEKDLNELYECFDSTFLHIFPTFVQDINALLRPEEQLEMDGNHLTTQIRIFALIRLGINESAKIAEFLHYSVNTIYNYRAKIKNAAIDHDNFEEQVKAL